MDVTVIAEAKLADPLNVKSGGAYVIVSTNPRFSYAFAVVVVVGWTRQEHADETRDANPEH